MVKEEIVREAHQTRIVSIGRDVISTAGESISPSIQAARDMANQHVILLKYGNPLSLAVIEILGTMVKCQVMIIRQDVCGGDHIQKISVPLLKGKNNGKQFLVIHRVILLHVHERLQDESDRTASPIKVLGGYSSNGKI